MLLFSNINDALLLMALGIGYLVLYAAKREEKGLQFLGYVIGYIIILLAAVFLTLGVLIQANIKCQKRLGPRKAMMQQQMMHPRGTTP